MPITIPLLLPKRAHEFKNNACEFQAEVVSVQAPPSSWKPRRSRLKGTGVPVVGPATQITGIVVIVSWKIVRIVGTAAIVVRVVIVVVLALPNGPGVLRNLRPDP